MKKSKLLDDPRLTAYALNELPPNEAKEFEMELQNDPEAKKEVEEIRQTATFLKEGLGEEVIPRLEVEQREAIYQKSEKTPFLKTIWGRLSVAIPTTAVAVLVLLNVNDFGKYTITKVSDIQDDFIAETTKPPLPIKADLKQVSAPPQKLKKIQLEKVFVGAKKSRNKGAALADFTTSSAPMAEEASFRSSGGASVSSTIARPMPTSHFMMPKEQKSNTESYDSIETNQWTNVGDQPLSTFSIDVDTGSYSNMRRFLNQGRMPIKDSIRVEEFINYFSYDYSEPSGQHPFSVNLEVANSPWQNKAKLVRIGLKGKTILQGDRPRSNLVFLLDVSGSMNNANKLPLLREAMKMLLRKLGNDDRIAIAVYAGASGLVLDSTPATEKATILRALNDLRAGGATNGAAGIQLAYEIAKKNFIKGGVNRVILATDGDFNVGTTSRGSLVELIKEKAKDNIFLSVLGFGMGNYKDATLEELSRKGNGNYAYIDTLNEAKKVLVHDLSGTLITIAKDVKIQVEFNPTKVQAYRLVGYENRMLKAQDFNDDKKDAGEIGAGHTVTAIYEVLPHGVKIDAPSIDKLKYQKVQNSRATKAAHSNELLTVKLRYKTAEGNKSSLLSIPLNDNDKSFDEAGQDLRFATAVASFALKLRGDERVKDLSYDQIYGIAKSAKGKDAFDYRQEFLELIELTKSIQASPNH